MYRPLHLVYMTAICVLCAAGHRPCSRYIGMCATLADAWTHGRDCNRTSSVSWGGWTTVPSTLICSLIGTPCIQQHQMHYMAYSTVNGRLSTPTTSLMSSCMAVHLFVAVSALCDVVISAPGVRASHAIIAHKKFIECSPAAPNSPSAKLPSTAHVSQVGPGKRVPALQAACSHRHKSFRS